MQSTKRPRMLPPKPSRHYSIGVKKPPVSEILKHSIFFKGEKILGVKRESMMKFYDAEGNVPLHSAVHSGDIKVVYTQVNTLDSKL